MKQKESSCYLGGAYVEIQKKSKQREDTREPIQKDALKGIMSLGQGEWMLSQVKRTFVDAVGFHPVYRRGLDEDKATTEIWWRTFI